MLVPKVKNRKYPCLDVLETGSDASSYVSVFPVDNNGLKIDPTLAEER